MDGTRLHYWLGRQSKRQTDPAVAWFSRHCLQLVQGDAALLVDAGYHVLVPDMRGYGDSDKPAGTEGYDARALAEEFRALCRQIRFGVGQQLLIAAHDMGAHPALLWAANYPDDIAALAYMDVPTMLEEFLTKTIIYTPEAMAKGSMWWWILPLAPGVPERLIVGHERGFLTWSYEGATVDPGSIPEATTDEILRTFSGTEGVLGSLGVYRAAFKTIAQTTLLKKNKVTVPILALGGEKGLGSEVEAYAPRGSFERDRESSEGMWPLHSRRAA